MLYSCLSGRWWIGIYALCMYIAHILHGDDGVLLRGRPGEQTAFSELRALLSRSESATSAGNVVGALWYGMPSLWLRSRNSRLTGVEYGIAEWCGIWPEWRKSMSVPKGRPTPTQHPKLKIQPKIKKHITIHKNKSQNQNSKFQIQTKNEKWQKQKRGKFT